MTLISFSLICFSACSIYKSAGRNSFESKAPANIQAVSVQSCDNVSELNLEISTHLSPDFQELISSTESTEIWKKTNANGSVNVTVIEKLEHDYSLCHYTFASAEEWLKVQADFFLD